MLAVPRFVDDKAGQDGLYGYAVDRHEDGGDCVGSNKDQDEKIDGLLHVGADRFHEGDEQIEEECGQSTYDEFAKHHKNLTYSYQNSVSCWVGSDQAESIIGGRAEVLSSHRYLNVGIPIETLYESFKAADTTPKEVNYALCALVALPCGLDVLIEDLNQKLYKLHEG